MPPGHRTASKQLHPMVASRRSRYDPDEGLSSVRTKKVSSTLLRGRRDRRDLETEC